MHGTTYNLDSQLNSHRNTALIHSVIISFPCLGNMATTSGEPMITYITNVCIIQMTTFEIT